MNNPKSVIRISRRHTAARNPNDRFGFNKIFKLSTNMTPSEYMMSIQL